LIKNGAQGSSNAYFVYSLNAKGPKGIRGVWKIGGRFLSEKLADPADTTAASDAYPASEFIDDDARDGHKYEDGQDPG